MQLPKVFTAWGWNPTGDWGPLTIYTAKNKKPVLFLKAPPKVPASIRQAFVRGKMTIIAQCWSTLPQADKDNWEAASKKARLRMTGYGLFQWFHWRGDPKTLATIERQSGQTLTP